MPTATAQLDSPWHRAKGDMTGDGQVDAFDVSAFESALSDPGAWESVHPGLDIDLQGDANQDGVFDTFDTDAFGQIVGQTHRYVTEAVSTHSRRILVTDIALNDIGHQGLMHDEEFQTPGSGSLVHNRAHALHPGMRR